LARPYICLLIILMRLMLPSTGLLRCRVVGRVGHCGAGLNSGGEFGEGVRDPVPWIDVGANFVVAAVEVLHEGGRALR